MVDQNPSHLTNQHMNKYDVTRKQRLCGTQNFKKTTNRPTAVFHSSPSSPTISSAVSPGVISTVLDESILRHLFGFFLARCCNTPRKRKKTHILCIYIYYIYIYLQLYKNSPFKPTMASFNPQNILVPKMQRKQTTKLPKKEVLFKTKAFYC